MGYRKTAMKTLKRLVQELTQGRYSLVYRGAIDWTSFDFNAHKFAASIFVPDTRINRNQGTVEAVITVDLFSSELASEEGVNDDVLDCLHDDAAALIKDMRTVTDSQGDNVFLSVEIINIVEAAFPATEHAPMGLLVNLEVKY